MGSFFSMLLVVFFPPADLSDQDFVNWHRTPGVGGDVELSVLATNEYPGNYQSVVYLTGLNMLRSTVNAAYNNGQQRVRAYGSRWSTLNNMYDSGVLIDSSALNYIKVGFGSNLSFLHSNHQSEADTMVFVQSGVMVRYVNTALEAQGLALPTTGAADGQRFVGAVSTGTHGSANSFGSMQDCVQGIHLVLPQNRHVFLQKRSDRVATSAFASDFLDGAELIEDDQLFYDALVGIGAFGVIHGMLFQAEPLYLLESEALLVPVEDLNNVHLTLQPYTMGLDRYGPTEVPYHFEIAYNSFRSGGQVAPVQIMRKLPLSSRQSIHAVVEPTSRPFRVRFSQRVSTEWLLALMPKFFKRWAFSKLVDALMPFFFAAFDVQTPKRPSEIFTESGVEDEYDQAPVPIVEFEISVGLDDLDQLLEIVEHAVHDEPIPSFTAVRYVKPSNATLAFGKLGRDISATLAIFGFYDRRFVTNFNRVKRIVARELVEKGIQHRYHLGKVVPDNDHWPVDTYGEATIQNWMQQRINFMGPDVCEMFTNDWMRENNLGRCS